MRFKFCLRPVEEIVFWDGNQKRPNLNWFALTDGWFWIEAGDQEVFRYSQTILKHWQADSELSLPYEDYQVARYWETLREMLPAILHPLPDDLAARVADAQAWNAFQDALTLRWPESLTERLEDTYSIACTWWGLRTWNASHLTYPPRLWLWRVGDAVHVRWDNRNITEDGIPVWEAQQGEVVVPAAEFMAAVEAFDAQFLAAMRARVDMARTAWPRPDVDIDRNGLERQQREHESGLDREHPLHLVEWDFTWDDVREAMATTERQDKNGNAG